MKQRILDHLLKFGTITTWEAIKEYGCTRLSQYIYLLRNEGYLVINSWEKATNRFGEPVHFKKYVLGGK